MPLYEIEYSDQKWIKIEKDESYNVVYKIPYSSIKDNVSCPTIENRFIVYILHGITVNSKDYIYVGKSTKGLDSRPSSHDSKYDDWTYCYVLTRKDDKFFNDAVIQYIEDAVRRRVDECSDFFIDTTDKTSSNTANQRDIKKSDEYLKDIYNRLFLLGLDLTPRHISKKITDYHNGNNGVEKPCEPSGKTDGQLWHLRSDNSITGRLLESGSMIIPSGTPVAPKSSESFVKYNHSYYKLRNQLIEEKIIVKNRFVKDYEFSSLSAAASVILGRASNGKTEWMNEENKTYKDLQ